MEGHLWMSAKERERHAHDYPFFKGLVDKTADSGFTMKEVSADKGYLGASNMLATLQRGAIPYIPFKSNSVPDSRGSYGAKSELSQAIKRRNDLSHDQVEVWSTLAESDSDSTSKRSVVQGALS